MKLSDAQKREIFENIDRDLEELIASLQALIRYPSVKKEPEGKLPFGKTMQDCLTAALELSEKLGFATRDLDGYIGIAEAGAGEESLGVLCHLDVVPAGAGWSMDPFEGVRKDEKIYGRGTMDDKGPAVCALYALKAVLDAGIPLKRRVQVILGCDEESGWACIDRFKQTEPMPTMSISPDGTYPLVFSEKGIYQGTFFNSLQSRVRIDCGERANVVPGIGKAWVPVQVKPEDCPLWNGIEVTCAPEGAGTEIVVKGLGAHASTPEEGRSALLYLVKLLSSLPLSEADGHHVFAGLADILRGDLHGEGFGLDMADESGRLTLNPGVLRLDENGLKLVVDIRWPLSCDPERLQDRLLGKLSPLGFTQVFHHVQPGHAVPRDCDLVKTLMAVYQEQTGDMKSEPMAIGGGTYARAFPNAVAFGCEFPGEPMLAHMPDEHMSIADIRLNARMLAQAIAELAM